MSSLSDLLDSDTLLDLAGAWYFQRAHRYVEEGRVGPIHESEFAIEGIVEGERTYGVRICSDGPGTSSLAAGGFLRSLKPAYRR